MSAFQVADQRFVRLAVEAEILVPSKRWHSEHGRPEVLESDFRRFHTRVPSQMGRQLFCILVVYHQVPEQVKRAAAR